MSVFCRDLDPETFRQDFKDCFSDNLRDVEAGEEDQLNINWLLLNQLFDLGQVLIVGAYKVTEGRNQVAQKFHKEEPMGYMVNIICPTLHKQDEIVAMTQSIYVKDCFRGKGVFQKLTLNSQMRLQKLGVNKHQLFLKNAQQEDLLGYAGEETVFIKRL